MKKKILLFILLFSILGSLLIPSTTQAQGINIPPLTGLSETIPPVPVGDAAIRKKEVGFTIFGIDTGISWDSIVIMLGRAMLDNIFDSMTDWVNRGFEGNPTFATDLNDYLSKVGDVVIGDALNEITNGFACEPFRLEIRAAIERDFGAGGQGKIFKNSCTLSEIEANVDNFLDGSFVDGGWPAWFRITQVDENNPYGSYLEARGAITASIEGARSVELAKLSWSQGFIDTRECLEYQTTVMMTAAGPVPVPTQICNKWGPVKTPGAVIANQVNKQFGASTDQLITADELDEFFAAVVNQLQNMVFSRDGIFRTGGAPRISGAAGDYNRQPFDLGTGACTVEPPAPIVVGSDTTWRITTAVNGSNPQYVWSGTDMSSTTNASSLKVSYSIPGDKNMSVTLSYDEIDQSQSPDPTTGQYPTTRKTQNVSCPTILVTPPPLAISCILAPLVINSPSSTNHRISPTDQNDSVWDGPNDPDNMYARYRNGTLTETDKKYLVVWQVTISGGSGKLDRITVEKDSGINIGVNSQLPPYLPSLNYSPAAGIPVQGNPPSITLRLPAWYEESNIFARQNLNVDKTLRISVLDSDQSIANGFVNQSCQSVKVIGP